MSAILKSSDNNILKYVYLIYDFNQVSDSMFLIMYVDKLKSWQNFFIHKIGGHWNTEVIKRSTKRQSYVRICNKLELVFDTAKTPSHIDEKNFEQTMQNHAALLLGLCS